MRSPLLIKGENMRVLCIGWGVQSFCLAAMSALGEIDKLDFIVHSDTTHEKTATYDFIAKYLPWLESHGIFVANVGNDENLLVNSHNFVTIPVFVRSEEGNLGRYKRQCTAEWKIWPIRRFLYEEHVTEPVELWFGISTDEFERAKDSDVNYITHRYPLLELDMAREDCEDWLVAHHLDVPPKSACVFCPYTYLDDWRTLKTDYPEDFARAVEVDNSLRAQGKPYYLTRHLIPLSELDDFSYTPKYALDAECDSGHCFL